MRRILPLVILLCSALPVLAASPPGSNSSGGVPKDLELYVGARLAEASGNYRKALDLYAKAMVADPKNGEIRVSFAALLEDINLVAKALDVIEPVQDLDWYGRKIKALALAAVSATRPDRLGDAEAALRELLSERAEDPNVTMALVQVLQREGKLDEAEKTLHALRLKHPASPRLIVMEATLLRSLGRLDEASRLFSLCAQSGPAEAGCRQQLVDVLIERNRPAEAADVLSRGLTDEDLDDMLQAASLYLRGGRSKKALALVRRVLASDPDSPRATRMRAFLLAAVGRYREAAAQLQALYRKHRDDTDLGLALAWAEARAGNLPGGRKLVAKLWQDLKKNPSSHAAVQCCLTGARIELLAGRIGAAREWLARVGDVNEGGTSLVSLLAETYRRSKEWSGGVGAMLRLQPQLHGDARNQAIAYEAEFRLRLGEPGAVRGLRRLLDASDVGTVRLGLEVLQVVERWQDVEQEAARALKRFPGNHDLLFFRGAALERLGKLDDSAEIFEKILASSPDDASTANYLGYMWADAGIHLDRAFKLISHAVELDPENPAYMDSLGWVYFRLGKLAEAEQWLRRAAASGSSPDGTILAHLGEVLARQGKTGEAARTLDRALAVGCEQPNHVREILGELKKGK